MQTAREALRRCLNPERFSGEPIAAGPARRALYSGRTPKENAMSDAKSLKAPAVEPLSRYTPVEAVQRKKSRDARRVAIRSQNVRSKSIK
jgi:hypothetical protein